VYRPGHEADTHPGMSRTPTYDAAVAAVRSSPVGWVRLALALNSARRQRQGRLLLRVTVIAASLVALKAFVIDPLSGHFAGSFEDFSVYLGAARSIAVGGSPYAHFDPGTVVMSGFIYPPFAAVLISPLGALSDRGAVSLWLVLELFCTIAAAVILARTALPKGWPRVELGLLAALTFAPATYNYWHGQINPLIFLLLVLAYQAYVRDRDIVCGVCIGLAAGIKLAPIVLVLLLLRRRFWGGAVAALATGAVTAVVGFLVLGAGASHTFLTSVLPALNRATGWIYNQSLGGLVSRLGGQSVLRVQPTSLAVTVGSIAAAVGVLAVATWTVRPDGRSAEERGAEFGLGVTAMMLAGSISWFPHFTYLLIPLFAAVGLVASRGWRTERTLLTAAAATLLVFAVVAPAAIARLNVNWIALSHSAAWWPLLQLFSLPCLAAVWLLVALATSLHASGTERIDRELHTARHRDRQTAPVAAAGRAASTRAGARRRAPYVTGTPHLTTPVTYSP
jgi:alpha-1,2-mannosyltransferase